MSRSEKDTIIYAIKEALLQKQNELGKESLVKTAKELTLKKYLEEHGLTEVYKEILGTEERLKELEVESRALYSRRRELEDKFAPEIPNYVCSSYNSKVQKIQNSYVSVLRTLGDAGKQIAELEDFIQSLPLKFALANTNERINNLLNTILTQFNITL
jgi:flagellar motility protein MotE (MotC chaperone)